MIATTVKMLTLSFFWSALWTIGWVALLDGGMPDIMHPSIEVGVATLLFLFAFACLLADLPEALAQTRREQKERAELEERAAAARAHTQFLILQERAGRRMRNAQIQRVILQGVTAGLEAFCEQWDAAHTEGQEGTNALAQK